MCVCVGGGGMGEGDGGGGLEETVGRNGEWSLLFYLIPKFPDSKICSCKH